MDSSDLAWLAGLLEGEGSFTHNGTTPTVSVSMTDKDVIERAAKLMNSRVDFVAIRGLMTKPQYRTMLHGIAAVELLIQLRPQLGKRRGEKVDELIADYGPLDVVCGGCQTLFRKSRRFSKFCCKQCANTYHNHNHIQHI